MILSRRSILQGLAAGSAFPRFAAGAGKETFQPDWESLKQFRCPKWFADAKFGIWAHWGPQCVAKQGDWYARNMYIEGSPQYLYHVAHYGHPSKFGYKDIIPLWKAENWEPETLIRRYRKAGAKYFVALGSHCDNFDCWNSRYHRWNAVKVGPHKDIVGTWRKAARQQGLRFGVTEHMAWSYSWFNVNKGADKKGPYAGVPYDGNDPKYQDLYFQPHKENGAHYPQNPPDSWSQLWFHRVKDLVDQHDPDLVYTDGGVFGDVGRQLIAHYYNLHRDGVYTLKNLTQRDHLHGEFEPGISVLDIERGVVDDIRPDPWQTDTCLGNWFYKEGIQYKTAQNVIHMLVDIVSKNGNLLLNFPLMPDGTLDTREEDVLEGITQWFAVNGDAIYDTRPWTVCGEGPTRIPSGSFGEKEAKPFMPSDFRFTTKNGSLFVFAMGWPEGDIRIKSLGTDAALWKKNIARITVIGSDEKIQYTRGKESLVIERPKHRPSEYATVFKIDA